MTVLTNGQRERDLLERIPVPDLVRAWRQDFGIDVAALFEGADQIELKRDPGSGVLHFDPPSSVMLLSINSSARSNGITLRKSANTFTRQAS